MRLMALAGALALAACAQGDGNDAAADNGMAADETATSNDPATADLNLESNAAAVGQAVNQTDQQSGLGNAADNAADSAGNTVE